MEEEEEEVEEEEVEEVPTAREREPFYSLHGRKWLIY